MSKKFLVHDGGIFCEQANGLADGGKNKVKYFTEYAGTFPQYHDYAKGLKFGHLEKVPYFWEWIDWADCIVNFDVGHQDMISYLREKYPKKSIWGAGDGGRLEDDRHLLKQMISKMGLPEQKYEHIKGMTKLREYLKKNPKKYVKINVFREDMESFYVKDYESARIKIDHLQTVFGPHSEDYEFIVEECIDSDVEIGFDGIFNGTDFLFPCFMGYEVAKGEYIAKVIQSMDELPKQIKETMTKFKPLLQKLEFRGALSTEEKITKDGHYFLDFCARLAAPLSAGYPQWIKNWPEVVYAVGKGENIKPDIRDKYVGAFPLKSNEGLDSYVKVDVKESDRDKIKFQMVCGDEKKNYFNVEGYDELCVLVSGGNSVDEVIKGLKKASDCVEAYGINKSNLEALDKMPEIIADGEKLGIDF